MVEIDRVTDRERPVEAVVVLERRDGGGIGGGLLAEVRRDGVARHELGEDERNERDPDQEQDEGDEPPKGEAQEARGGPPPASGKGRRPGDRRRRHRLPPGPAWASESTEGRDIG